MPGSATHDVVCPGLDQRILDPTVPGTYIDGGVADGNGRTDDEIIADFARALAGRRRRPRHGR